MKKRYIVSICVIATFLIGIGVILILDRNVEIKTVKLLQYDDNKNEITIEIEKTKNILPFSYECILKTSDKVSPLLSPTILLFSSILAIFSSST